jgi:hypothetical protein
MQVLFERRGGLVEDFIVPSRLNYLSHLSARQYARLVDEAAALSSLLLGCGRGEIGD